MAIILFDQDLRSDPDTRLSWNAISKLGRLDPDSRLQAGSSNPGEALEALKLGDLDASVPLKTQNPTHQGRKHQYG